MKVDNNDLTYCKNCHTQLKSRSKQNSKQIVSLDEQFRNYRLKPNGTLELKWIQHELDLKVRFTEKEILLIDIPSNELQELFLVDNKIESIDLLTYPSICYHVNYTNQSCQNLTIEEFGLMSEVRTNSEYILKIDMQSINRGFYFGLYEIGEFELIDSKIKLLRSQKLHYVDRGWIIQDNTLILSLRTTISTEIETSDYKYFITAFVWEKDKKLKKLWEIKTTSSLRGLIQLKDDMFIFGYMNGKFEIFSSKKRKSLKSTKLFDTGFSYMCLKNEKIYCSSYKGEVACLTMNGTVVWKKTFGDSRIYNIETKNDQLHFISGKRNYYILSASNGDVIKTKQFTFGSPQNFSSNFIFIKEWFIISGQAHLAHIHKSGKEIFIHANDPLIRVLQAHSKGYITGDEGKLSFYKEKLTKYKI
jgi:hypothetical protein